MEKAIEGRPNNPNLRFEAAYTYSQQSFARLALFHYRLHLGFHPDDPVSLNNLGVEYGRLTMPSKSIRHYKKSAGFNDTLAMANLANTYMNVGFISEAEQILTKARAMSEVHPNVGSAIAELGKIEAAEKETETKCIEAARDQQRFFSEFAEAYFITPPKKPREANFSGRWKFLYGMEIDITQANGQIESNWESGGAKYSLRATVRNRGFKGTLETKSAHSLILANDITRMRIFAYTHNNSSVFQMYRTGESDENYSIESYEKRGPIGLRPPDGGVAVPSLDA